jgi:hypothetical protein
MQTLRVIHAPNFYDVTAAAAITTVRIVVVAVDWHQWGGDALIFDTRLLTKVATVAEPKKHINPRMEAYMIS